MKNPEISDNVSKTEAVPMQHDFRSVYGSILMDWFGASEDTVKSILYDDFQYLPIIKGCSTTATDPEVNDPIFEVSIKPNPVRQNASLEFVSKDEHVKIGLYNELGAEIDVLTNKRFSAGKHEMTINTAHLKSGVYFVRLTNSERQKTKRFVKM